MTETLKRGFPGMQSVKDMKILQDGPPAGGFPSIRIDRRLPSTGPTGVTIFAVGAAVAAFGYYKVYEMIQKRKANKSELQYLRAAMIPVLQAETDLRYVAAQAAAVDKESKIMAKVPGWEVDATRTGASGRWLAPLEEGGMWNPFVR